MSNDERLEEPSSQERLLASPPRRPCVLVVDDDGTIRAMLKGALARDYEVVCLANGDAVARAIEVYRPQLLLLDVNILGDDGYEICRRVREQARKNGLPILFMTVRRDDAAFLKSLDSGGDAFIRKPFEIAALLEKIDCLLKRRF